jgi:hypothetical protein
MDEKDPDDVLVRINTLNDVIRKTPPSELKERVYICMANGCILLTAYKRTKGEKGWSSKLHDEFGKPMLTTQEQETVESSFAKAPWILDMLESSPDLEKPAQKVQKGGFAMKVPSLKIPGSQFLEDSSGFTLTGQDVSMDALFDKFLKKSEEMDQFWGRFAYESPGFIKMINKDIPIYKDIKINGQPIASLLVLILDSIRLSYGLAGQKTQVLTTLVLLEEVLTGQWRQMLLTAVGFLSPTGMAVGVLFKYLVNAWTLINPDLRTQIVKDSYKGTKSVLIGFLLWAFSAFSPSFIREKVEAIFARVREKVEGFEQKIKSLEESGSAKLASQGKQVRIRGVDLTQFKTLSMVDIQNLQALATWDVFVCSSEFQEIVAPLEASPIFRLILELMNIPTTPADKYAACGDAPYKSISDEVSESLKPTIEDTPEAVKAAEVASSSEGIDPAAEAEVISEASSEGAPPAAPEGAEAEVISEASSEGAPPAAPEGAEAEVISGAPPAVTKAEVVANTPPAVPAVPVPAVPVPAVPVPPVPAVPVKVGGRIFKLKKKSTRYRKATPRRATRRKP